MIEGLDHRDGAEAELLEPHGERHEIALVRGVEQLLRIVLGEAGDAPHLL